jgi:pyruvate dehydrogenase E1 component
VATSTNLAGFINRTGVFAPVERRAWSHDAVLKWAEGPQGQHIELGISEMNLFLLLGQLGLAWDLSGQPLLPVGTVYDPFVCRGLDAFIYSVYSGARFVVCGTPSGVTLAPEGGAHQSTITPSIGLELPGLMYAEPAFAQALDWLLCDGLAELARPDGGSLYLRLSTRPIDQRPFALAAERIGAEALRADVLAGGYRLREPEGSAAVVLAACGPLLPEVLTAAGALDAEGAPALVLDLTSPDRLYRGWRDELRGAARGARPASATHHLAALLRPGERALPIVTVHDAASHHLAWMGGVFGAPTVPVGVDEFGQSGSIPELYGLFDLLSEQIVNAALVAVSSTG